MKSLVIGIVLLLFTGFMVVSLIAEKRNYTALQKEGIAGKAEIEGASTAARLGGTIYHLHLKHAADSGGIHTEQEVPQTIFDELSPNAGVSTPRSVSIRYLPRNPKVFEITDPWVPTSGYYAPSIISWLGVLMLGAASISLLRTGLRHRK